MKSMTKLKLIRSFDLGSVRIEPSSTNLELEQTGLLKSEKHDLRS